jgi:hypothetical protein
VHSAAALLSATALPPLEQRRNWLVLQQPGQ